ncbi:hypothetical protein P873_06760 [Arenimonas composti TR7-09 = DSM 18010]|uniref:Uncharacterized protein n=1 Tax=Arenimonas composti TR7-09 = DSM 18010 TaxID=1121013 RepID=A0A091BCH1_9GAMM|nr:hypothetical protein P873_06760 [Arenimonas composti TR7-09 = DSM 18010]
MENADFAIVRAASLKDAYIGAMRAWNSRHRHEGRQ